MFYFLQPNNGFALHIIKIKNKENKEIIIKKAQPK